MSMDTSTGGAELQCGFHSQCVEAVVWSCVCVSVCVCVGVCVCVCVMVSVCGGCGGVCAHSQTDSFPPLPLLAHTTRTVRCGTPPLTPEQFLVAGGSPLHTPRLLCV